MLPDKFENQYCSWCYNKTVHRLVERNYLTRNDYQCTSCKNYTVQCRYCQNMCKHKPGDADADGYLSKLKEGWASECCAEHDGEIANFENLNMRLDDIEDFAQVFERNKWNLAKAGLISGTVLGSALVFAPLSFLAAPALAASLGSAGLLGAAGTGTAISTLHGAALTSASLAAVGGGYGVAGGMVLVTAAGAALGARKGAVIANNYFGAVKDFDIWTVREGKGPSIIFINGFLSQSEPRKDREWSKAVKQDFSNHAWYQTNWESKNLFKLGSLISEGAGLEAFKKTVSKLAKRSSKKAGSKLNPLNWATVIAELFGNPWHSAMVKAAMTGLLLADIIARSKNSEGFILMGHSLGARVAYYALEALSTMDRKCIKDVYLLGGAVDRKDDEGWGKAASAVEGNIYNCYSKNDDVLRWLYQPANAFISDPIGLGDIEAPAENIKNIDVTGLVGGHMQYKAAFPEIMDEVGI